MVAKIFILVVSIVVIVALVIFYLKNESFKKLVDSIIKKGRKLARNQESLVNLAAEENNLSRQKKRTEIAEEKEKTLKAEEASVMEGETLSLAVIAAQKKIRERISEEKTTLNDEIGKAKLESELILEKLKSGACPDNVMVKPAGWLERNWWFPLVLFFTLFIILIKFGVLI